MDVSWLIHVRIIPLLPEDLCDRDADVPKPKTHSLTLPPDVPLVEDTEVW